MGLWREFDQNLQVLVNIKVSDGCPFVIQGCLIPSGPVDLARPNLSICKVQFHFFGVFSLKKIPPQTPTPRAASLFSLCIILHALRDPLQISRLWPWTDFLSLNQKCPQRSISAKLLRMSWPAVLLICLSSQASPGIRSCLLRLSESTLENITHGRDGGDLKEGKKSTPKQ